jgi:hypothetical protein
LRYDILTTDTARSRWLLLPVIALLTLSVLPGCSLGIMAGKMLFGDPKGKSQFRSATGVDLTKGEKSLLIVCSAPYGVLAKQPSIQLDIVDRMTRILDKHNVKVISTDDVAAWFDDHGEWGDFSELSDEFDADFVMHIQIEAFNCEVPDSPNLLQGKADGKVTVLEAEGSDSKTMSMAFERTFDVTFPSYPVPRENKSEQLFTEGFLDRTAISLTHFLYDHRASETVH